MAIPRHYINIIWHYGWHILCKAKSQIILPISCTSSNIDCGNACRLPLPMPILSLAVPGQMPKCSGWCQFRYCYCCWPVCWIYYSPRVDNRPIIFVLGRSFRFFRHFYICSPARRPSSERTIILFTVYVFSFSFYELS